MVQFNTMVSSPIVLRLLLLSQLGSIASSEGLRGVGGGVAGYDGNGNNGAAELSGGGDHASPPWANATQTTAAERRRRRRLGEDEDELHHHADHIIPPPSEIQARIIGGGTATPGRYPYTVALTDQGGLFCGGSLITSDMVLTAAHCGDNKQYIKFVLGAPTLSRGGVEVFPKRGWIHDKYNWQTMDNDVMIYMLDGEVAIGGDVGLVRLNSNERVPARMGERLLALGWGDTNPGLAYQSSDNLLKVGVGYIPNNECTKRTGMVGSSYVSFNGQVKSNMLCALDRGKDGCQGDSGGPLVAEGSDPKGRTDVLVGLSSWGVDCAHATLPGVYTRVSTQYKWISDIVCEFSKNPPVSFGCRNSGGGGGSGGGGSGNGPKPGGIKPRPNSPNVPKPKPPPIFTAPKPKPPATVSKPRPPPGGSSKPKPKPGNAVSGPRPNSKPKPNNKPSVSKPKPNNNNSKPKPGGKKPGKKGKKKKKKKKKNKTKNKMNYFHKNKQRITRRHEIFQ